MLNDNDEEKKRLYDAETKLLYNDVFKKDQNSPEAWGATAANLRIAADVLFQAYGETWEGDEPLHPENQHLDSPATMLYGCAMENVIKGYLIKKHEGFDKARAANQEAWERAGAKDQKAWEKLWQHHKISKLAEATGLPLTSEQKLLLQSLQSFIRWTGRYPIPMGRDEFTILKQFHSGDDMTPNQIEPAGIKLLEPFYKQLEDDIFADAPRLVKHANTPPSGMSALTAEHEPHA